MKNFKFSWWEWLLIILSILTIIKMPAILRKVKESEQNELMSKSRRSFFGKLIRSIANAASVVVPGAGKVIDNIDSNFGTGIRNWLNGF